MSRRTRQMATGGAAMLGLAFAFAAPLIAQPAPGAAFCKADSHCGLTPCNIWQGGPINNCNCCSIAGAWVCCDNVPCPYCFNPQDYPGIGDA